MMDLVALHCFGGTQVDRLLFLQAVIQCPSRCVKYKHFTPCYAFNYSSDYFNVDRSYWKFDHIHLIHIFKNLVLLSLI